MLWLLIGVVIQLLLCQLFLLVYQQAFLNYITVVFGFFLATGAFVGVLRLISSLFILLLLWTTLICLSTITFMVTNFRELMTINR